MRLLLSVLLTMFVLSGCGNTPKVVPPGELDLATQLQPLPMTAKFEEPGYFVWCGSPIKGDDGKVHLYYSRWKKEYGFSAWVTHSEVAHAVSDSPFGPFEFSDLVLPTRDTTLWDGLCTHNPTIHKFDGKYYLYYMGNTGDGVLGGTMSNVGAVQKTSLNWTHRNNQRIGVAVSDTPYGPWARSDKPLIDVSADSTAGDALLTSNPSVARTPEGKYLMVYKAVGRKKPLPGGGLVVHMVALSDYPDRGFVKQPNLVFTADKFDFPAEDPYIWYQDNCFYAIVKDMHGAFTDAGQSLVLFYSMDGIDWQLAKHPLVSTLKLTWEDGSTETVAHLERPQLYFENGVPVALFAAADYKSKTTSFNVQIPLKNK